MNRARLVVGLMLCLALSAWAQDGGPLAAGNRAYQAGDYQAAVREYNLARGQGYDGWATRFNLGNAYYRQGDRAEAIANWLAAERLAPRDADVRANLDLAFRERPQGPPAPPASWLHAAVEAVIGRFTLSELAIAATLFLWATAGVVVAVLLRPRQTRGLRRLGVALGVLGLAAAGLAFGRWWDYYHVQTAVVRFESADLYSGPGDDFEVIAPLTQGCLVRFTGKQRGWAHVVAEDGSRGWVSGGAFITVELGRLYERLESGG